MIEAQMPIQRQTLIEFLTGKESNEISEMKLDEMESFGIGDSHDEDFWANIVDAAYEKGYLKEKSTRNDALTLSAEGKKFYKKPVSFIISDEEEENNIPDTESNLEDIIKLAGSSRTPIKNNITSGHAQQFINLIRAIDRKIDLDDIYALASVDVKEKESGLWELAQHLRVPFVVFSAGELKKVSGDFTASAFVSRTVGVDNVCERAAVAAADGGSLLIHKQAMDGVTIAVAKREKIVLQFV